MTACRCSCHQEADRIDNERAFLRAEIATLEGLLGDIPDGDPFVRPGLVSRLEQQRARLRAIDAEWPDGPDSLPDV